jgi:Protein of unknown function DUF58
MNVPPHEKADAGIYVTLAGLVAMQHQARGFSFLPRQPIGSLLSGRHASHLRGRGLNFEEIRHYLPGDDIRQIDWKATVRTGKTQSRVYAHAADHAQLAAIYRRLDELETHQSQSVSYRPRRDFYWLPLAIGLILTAAQLAGELLAHRFHRPADTAAKGLRQTEPETIYAGAAA